MTTGHIKRIRRQEMTLKAHSTFYYSGMRRGSCKPASDHLQITERRTGAYDFGIPEFAYVHVLVYFNTFEIRCLLGFHRYVQVQAVLLACCWQFQPVSKHWYAGTVYFHVV